jgi:KaiC/GvpD/RAD55 family RecA-like ATPase
VSDETRTPDDDLGDFEIKPLPMGAAILRALAAKPPQRTYATGFGDLDELIAGGVKSKQVTTVGGPTGGGKTSFIGSIVMKWLSDGIPVLWAHTEIPEDEQAARLAAIALYRKGVTGANVTADGILGGRFDLEQAAVALDGLPFYCVDLDAFENIDDEPRPFQALLGAIASVKKTTGKDPIVIVDYVQEIADTDEDQRRVSVTKTVKKLRRIGQKHDVAVVAVSSVSRAFYPGKKIASDEDEDPIFWLASAKESGDVEYSSAVYAYLETDTKCDQLGNIAARLIVAKSRRGMRGKVGLRFHGPSGNFEGARESLEKLGATKKTELDDAKVMTFVRRKDYRPLTQTDLVEGCGIAVTRARSSVKRLLAAGDLVKRPKPNAKRGEVVVPMEWEPPQVEMRTNGAVSAEEQ